MPADLVLINGRIYTIDNRKPLVSALAIADGRLLAVGENDDALKYAGSDTEVVDLEQRCVSPGLVDAHVHFRSYSLGLQRVNLGGTADLGEALQQIAARADERTASPEKWLLGRGWQQDEWAERAFPTAAHLDSVVPNQPVYLTHKSGHAGWANSRAMQLAGVDAQTVDPPGGQIQRDANGRPTGIFFEEAMKLISEHVPYPSPEEVADAMRYAQGVCWRAGLTGIHDFDGPSCFQALQMLHANEELGLRVVKNIPVAQLDNAVAVGLRTGFGDDWLRIGGIKIFADGALGPRTAAMLAPYEDEPVNSGIVITDKEEIVEKASRASAHGLSVTVHAIGDRANHDVLDAYETVRQQESSRGESVKLRHRIEHVQLLHPDDLHRLAQLNVIASMQPIHATSDMEIADKYWGARARYSYAWRMLKESGATLVFGSDAPVESIEPLLGIYAAVTRRRPDGSPNPDGWYPEQKLTMHETIHGFTLSAALTSGQEHRQGSIAPGKLADLTVYDRDLFTVPADELPDVRIAGTIVGGEVKYRNW